MFFPVLLEGLRTTPALRGHPRRVSKANLEPDEGKAVVRRNTGLAKQRTVRRKRGEWERLLFVDILAYIKGYRAGNDDALDDLLPVGVYVDEGQAVVDDLEDKHAGYHAAHGTYAAG